MTPSCLLVVPHSSCPTRRARLAFPPPRPHAPAPSPALRVRATTRPADPTQDAGLSGQGRAGGNLREPRWVRLVAVKDLVAGGRCVHLLGLEPYRGPVG